MKKLLLLCLPLLLLTGCGNNDTPKVDNPDPQTQQEAQTGYGHRGLKGTIYMGDFSGYGRS